MMTDVFVEYMVKKKTGSKDVLMSLGVSILGAILIFVSIFLTPVSPMIPFLVICGVIYGVYYVISSRSLEFEYSITNGDIAVDKIINRRSVNVSRLSMPRRLKRWVSTRRMRRS